jgi:hypothetical protein
LNLGYTILSVTRDDKRGVNSVFKLSCTNMPFQPETYYSKIYYITEAIQELKKIMTRLKYSDESRFTKALDIWYIKYKVSFILIVENILLHIKN